MQNIEQYELINQKLFRRKENWKKVEFIIANSNITIELILKAAIVARRNEYHNFGHELGATEYGIKIAQDMELSQNEINELAIALLFHDAGHRGIVHKYDELRSIQLMNEVMREEDYALLNIEKGPEKMRDLIITTIFPTNRGKITTVHAKIMQDADLAHIGQGLEYWLYGSMGLIEEFNRNRMMPLTPVEFIHNEQEKFIDFLKTLSPDGKVFLSDGAKRTFIEPEETLKELKAISPNAIEYAYSVRRDDVTLQEFSLKINQLK